MLAIAAAPAIVRASSLMQLSVPRVWTFAQDDFIIVHPTLYDIIQTTLKHRAKEIAANVVAENALLRRLSLAGTVLPFNDGALVGVAAPQRVAVVDQATPEVAIDDDRLDAWAGRLNEQA